ncbi:anthranilate n-hydroxycinnamoyl/benzoyltransferase [Pochonia chlamydosporia 170]|uniref:Anthranilate n-hydroxycinnamoyl/benzoyltransferase n=1 Tax=Pochonia chlamydosporia 170 TaxID=1380566 RepID=A0A179FNI2_METCM|nr:anthranilate n-hydroxycinnamoyl/benzoyltransferase [Pochonia chlamydosporia 170]OAQ67134.1 anthranilate n-hydroxycinnamoyl/benzoyltransferase [Pochonia chlamydosporia 170]
MSAEPLSTWDQIAPRDHVRQVFCFPYQGPQDGDLQPLRQVLRSALDRACTDLPDFAGRVVPVDSPPGHLFISKHGNDRAKLDVIDDSETSPFSYEELKARGFPPGAFVGSCFGLEQESRQDNQVVPATKIQARVIRGGLLLCIYVHHSVTDGIGLTNFVSTFARYTLYRERDELLPKSANLARHPELPIELTSTLLERNAFDDLMKLCPEYWATPHGSHPLTLRFGPTSVPFESIPKEGRIFVFDKDTIALLKETATRYQADGSDFINPSTFACLAALTWIFVTSARVRVKHKFSLGKELQVPHTNARIMVPASWSRRAFSHLINSKTGNTVAIMKLETELSNLIKAKMFRELTPATGKAFAKLVQLIEAGLAGIDEDFVTIRTAMFLAASDPRHIGLAHNPLDPCDFIINSWRHLGADTRWGIPGVVGDVGISGVHDHGIMPDAVRRAQPAWNMGAGLIMPGSKDSKSYEVLITLDSMSMAELCSDQAWMTWIDRVV